MLPFEQLDEDEIDELIEELHEDGIIAQMALTHALKLGLGEELAALSQEPIEGKSTKVRAFMEEHGLNDARLERTVGGYRLIVGSEIKFLAFGVVGVALQASYRLAPWILCVAVGVWIVIAA